MKCNVAMEEIVLNANIGVRKKRMENCFLYNLGQNVGTWEFKKELNLQSTFRFQQKVHKKLRIFEEVFKKFVWKIHMIYPEDINFSVIYDCTITLSRIFILLRYSFLSKDTTVLKAEDA